MKGGEGEGGYLSEEGAQRKGLLREGISPTGSSVGWGVTEMGSELSEEGT